MNALRRYGRCFIEGFKEGIRSPMKGFTDNLFWIWLIGVACVWDSAPDKLHVIAWPLWAWKAFFQ